MFKLSINTKVDKVTLCNINTIPRKVLNCKNNTDDQTCLTKRQDKGEFLSMLAHNSKTKFTSFSVKDTLPSVNYNPLLKYTRSRSGQLFWILACKSGSNRDTNIELSKRKSTGVTPNKHQKGKWDWQCVWLNFLHCQKSFQIFLDILARKQAHRPGQRIPAPRAVEKSMESGNGCCYYHEGKDLLHCSGCYWQKKLTFLKVFLLNRMYLPDLIQLNKRLVFMRAGSQ